MVRTAALIFGLAVMSVATAFADDAPLVSQLRRPTALALSSDEAWLYVANQRSGSISAVDIAKRAVVGEQKVGKRLSAIVAIPGNSRLLALDEAGHELIVLRATGPKIEVLHRVAVAAFPVTIALRPDGRWCSVASLWSRRLTWLEIPADEKESPRVAHSLDLDFSPRSQTLFEDGRLLVADAFGGKIALVEVSTKKILGQRMFFAHNVRGLGATPDGKMWMAAHQILNEYANSIRNDVHWGVMLSNDLRWLRRDKLLAAGDDFYTGGHIHPLGEPGNASGDPTDLAMSRDGTVAVALGGVSEIATGKEFDFNLQRVSVGKRPVAVALSSDSKKAFVANQHGESISIVDVGNRESIAEVALGPTPELTAADEGELLFYNARLSHDGWMSCHSCHTDGHSSGQLNDNFSDKSFGAPKRVISLLGVKETSPYAWNGGRHDLGEQIKASVTVTMQGNKPLTDKQTASLVAYLETLEAPPSIEKLRGTQDDAAIGRGKTLFTDLSCVRCHAPPTYTTPRTYDVGLSDKKGLKEFNPPSLRGVGHREPLFHEGQAANLSEVLTKFKHKLRRDLEPQELSDLQAFLRSL